MKKVVILGGGFCGSFCAKVLDDPRYDVTLIDPKPSFENKPYVHRLITDNTYSITTPYSTFLQNVKRIQDTAKEVTQEFIIVDSGKKLLYDYLLIATGSYTPVFIKTHPKIFVVDSIEQVNRLRKHITAARNITIVGGGFTGIEVAGELCTKTTAEITIIEASNRILARLPLKAAKYATAFLTKHGVNILTNEKTTRFDGKHTILESSKKIPTGLLIWCVGIKPRLPRLYFTPEVNQYYQQIGHENIYFGGDTLPLQFEKNGKNAELHGKLIGKTIKSLLDGSPKLQKVRFNALPSIESLGDHHGSIIWRNFVWNGLLPSYLKSFVKKLIEWQIRY